MPFTLADRLGPSGQLFGLPVHHAGNRLLGESEQHRVRSRRAVIEAAHLADHRALHQHHAEHRRQSAGGELENELRRLKSGRPSRSREPPEPHDCCDECAWRSPRLRRPQVPRREVRRLSRRGREVQSGEVHVQSGGHERTDHGRQKEDQRRHHDRISVHPNLADGGQPRVGGTDPLGDPSAGWPTPALDTFLDRLRRRARTLSVFPFRGCCPSARCSTAAASCKDSSTASSTAVNSSGEDRNRAQEPSGSAQQLKLAVQPSPPCGHLGKVDIGQPGQAHSIALRCHPAPPSSPTPQPPSSTPRARGLRCSSATVTGVSPPIRGG
jgi:hypothetical protein